MLSKGVTIDFSDTPRHLYRHADITPKSYPIIRDRDCNPTRRVTRLAFPEVYRDRFGGRTNGEKQR